MSRLAGAVGVSRQTVYNEIGSKPALAEAMVLHELERFLAVVDEAFDRHDAAATAVRAAAFGVLELARNDTLLRAVASATHGTDTELLPLLSTQARSLLDTAKTVLAGRLGPLAPCLTAAELDVAVDVVVRVVLSHVMQPSGSPAATADAVGWTVGRLIPDKPP